MSNQPDPTKRLVSARIDIELCRRIEKSYSRPGDVAKYLPFIRALEDATRDIVLDAEDYELIAEEIRENKRRAGK